MSEEWGPWIEHDGMHIPNDFSVGDIVQLLSINNAIMDIEVSAPKQVVASDFVRYNWFWGESTHDVLRYRIRKPRGMTILENLIADLPAPSLEPSPINETAPREGLPA